MTMADEDDKDEKDDEKASRDDVAKTAAKSGVRDIRWMIFVVVAMLNLVADQGTKIWARDALGDDVSQGGWNPNNVVNMSPEEAKALLSTPCSIPRDLITNIEYRFKGTKTEMVAKCHGNSVPFIGNFWSWRLSMNTGSAFGLFGSSPGAARVFLSIVGLLAVGGMLWMLRKCRSDQRILQWALAFVAGGAIGNLIDRV